MSNTEYTGKVILRVFNREPWFDGVYTLVEIDFDHPDTMEKIKEMSTFRGGSPDKTAPFAEHLKFFLQLVACDAASLERNGELGDIHEKFRRMEGYYPLDGRHGITLLHTEVPRMKLDEFDIEVIKNREELENWSD